MSEKTIDKYQRFYRNLIEREAEAPFNRTARIVFDPSEDPDLPFGAALYRLKAGQRGPKHCHDKAIEIYVILQGRGSIVINGQTRELTPDSLLYVPPGMAHETVSHGPEDLLILGIFIPPVDFSEVKNKWKLLNVNKIGENNSTSTKVKPQKKEVRQ